MIFQPGIDEYLLRVTPDRPAVMQEMEAYAAQHHFPIVGPLVGRFLYQAAKMVEARRVIEFGSGFGYSAYWFALAMGRHAKITMIDGSEENRERAMSYFERAGIESKVKFKVGDAFEVLNEVDKEFDIVFNDVDKEQYPRTIDPAASHLRRGGLFITDNLLWSGRVCKEPQDAATAGVTEFTKKLYSDPRFFTTILPIRDGIALAIRS